MLRYLFIYLLKKLWIYFCIEEIMDGKEQRQYGCGCGGDGVEGDNMGLVHSTWNGEYCIKLMMFPIHQQMGATVEFR